jgi:hypothetical protein
MSHDPMKVLGWYPHVRDIRRDGGGSVARRIIHILDAPDAPEVVRQQADLLEALHETQGVDAVYLEGLTGAAVKEYEARVVNVVAGQAKLALLRAELAGMVTGRDEAAQELAKLEAEHNKKVGELGALALLACRGVRLRPLPLETPEGLARGAPRLEAGKLVRPGAEDGVFREQEMLRQLPRSGLAVVLLGASYHLYDPMDEDAEYVRVGVEAVVKALGMELPRRGRGWFGW